MKNLIKKGIKEESIENLNIPASVAFNLPLITIVGNLKINIENFKNMLEYSNTNIKILTTCGKLNIAGENLFIKELSKEKIYIKGNIIKIEFIL